MKHLRNSFIVFLGGAILLLIPQLEVSGQSDRSPVFSKLGLQPDDVMQISPEDRCPACAMKPFKNPKFAAAIVLTSGKTLYFCGTGCMMRALLKPKELLGVPKSDVKKAVVRDFFSGKFMDAQKVIWVAGSNVKGPMGRAIVPLASEKDADVFKKRHGGRITFRLGELTDALFQKITGRKPGK